jgi:two-component system LytT family response regulator
MKLRCLLIDDEPLAIQVLENLLKSAPDITIVGSCEHVREASQWFEQDPPDFIMLDINLPGVDGITFANTLAADIQVVFTTAYRDFAPEAFELNATDYLIKPIHPDRLRVALDKVRERYRSVASAGNSQQHLWITFGREQIKINVAEILYLESRNDHVIIHSNTQQFKYYDTLGNMEAQLAGAGFLRIHKSFLVNQSAVASFSAQQVKVGLAQIPIGRIYKQRVLTSLTRGSAS